MKLEPHGMKFTYASGAKPLAGFTIKRGIGVGGFGEVYFAVSDAGKEVALKRVQRNLNVELRGVSHCLNLKHPNLISLFDVRYDEAGQAWVVMEYVAGESLRSVVDGAPGGIGEAETRRWFAGLAAGVAHLHDSGIVHRDLKPGNLFDDDGIVKIGDYGLSKFISCSRRDGHTESVGTFHYMAPEVGRGNYGREIDIYALGIILYEMLTGTVPFDGESSHEIIMKHLTANPDLSGVAEPYRSVIWQALQKNPTARQQTVQQMIRPLGIEIDEHGMARLAPGFSAPQFSAPGFSACGAAEPVFQGVAVADHGRAGGGSQASPGIHFFSGNESDADAPAGVQFGEVRYHPTAAAVLTPEEPLARSFRSGLARCRQWWGGLEAFPGTRIILLILGLCLFILNIEWLLPLMAFLAVLYVPYYIIRAMTLSVSRQPSFAEAHHVAVARQQRPRPLSAKQWRQRRRGELATKRPLVRVAELGESLTTAGFAAAALAGLAFLVGHYRGVPATSTAVAPFVWSAAIALLAAVGVLVLGKLWERTPGGGLSRRVVLLGIGAAVGAAAFVLADFLMIPLDQRLARDIDVTELPSSMYSASGVPRIAALMAHFALLLAGLRWWRSADPLRRSRFSVWAVAVAVVASWGLHQLLPVPQPWGMITAGILAAVIQIATPWENPRQRLRDSDPTHAPTV
ncbi:serine/threonine-protein kinase [Candidatus Laterigemmans baculatus]|uniref:serine/threonine-protein kinase n=1 Tax=Candidatus Laterigemmans baculatus TaxID=2770505 RepID=UPI001F451F5D|nr:serine/threonine-protein kinase [Candidatus Laterigemmans baculatus]